MRTKQSRARKLAALLLSAVFSLSAASTGADSGSLYSDWVQPGLTATQAEAEHVSDLSQLLYTLAIEKDGEVQDLNSPIIVRPGDVFLVKMTFEETEEKQFRDDNSEPMFIDLPAGFQVPEDFSASVDVSVNVGGALYVVENNPVTYNADTHRLTLMWNTGSENFSKLTDSGSTRISLDLTGAFSVTEGQEITFGAGHTVTVGPPSNPRVTKTGVYHPDSRTITYDVVVEAEGAVSQPLTLTDALEGVALTYQQDVGQTALDGDDAFAARADLTTEQTDGGFIISIPSMTDGERLRFHYSASVDIEKLAVSGQTEEETRNAAVIANPGNPYNDPADDEAVHAENIDFCDLTKSASVGAKSDGVDSSGNEYRYQDVTWTIVTNSDAAALMGGSAITDSLEYDPSVLTPLPQGSGILVTVLDQGQDGETLETIDTRIIPWDQLNIHTETVLENPDDPSSRELSHLVWTYDIPETDTGSYRYEVTYVTRVNTSSMKAADTIYNTASGKGGVDMAEATIGPDGSRNIQITKTVTASDEETITWELAVTAFGEGHDSYVITDILPMKYLPVDGVNTPFKDSLVSVELVDGLLGGESFTVETIPRPASAADRVRITFMKGDDQPGLLPTASGEDRVIRLRVTTQNNAQWVERSTEMMATNPWYALHENRAEARADGGYDFDTARTAVTALNVRKQRDYLERYTTVTLDGVTYPVYRFVLYVGGVSESVLDEDGNLIITDIPDTEHPEYWKVMDTSLSSMAWMQARGYVHNSVYYPSLQDGALYIEPAASGATEDQVAGGHFSYTQAEDGVITFTITPPILTAQGEDGAITSFYPYHDVVYFLIPRDEEALEAIRQTAMDATDEEGQSTNGKATFTNTVRVGDKEASLDYDYTYRPMGKQLVSYARNRATFQIDLNPNGLQLGGGYPSVITMTDTFSTNLSVDYSSIQVTASGRGGAEDVSWDYAGYTGFFTIPDETHVTIIYSASVIGAPGEAVTFHNTVAFASFTQRLEETRTVTATSGGSAGVYQLRLFKYAEGHMESGLPGATFRLLDANKQPVRYVRGEKAGQPVTFTTGDDGFVTVTLSQSRDGLSIRKNTVYYLEEIQAPTVDGTAYHRDATYYSFLISDNPDYSAGGVYVYANGDILKIRNYEDEGGLYISKRFAGNVSPTAEQQAAIRFVLERQTAGGWETVATYPYSQFTSGVIHVDSDDLTPGVYRVREENAEVADWSLTVSAEVDSVAADDAVFTVAQGETASHSVSFTNTYVDCKYTLTKVDSASGVPLSGAVFSVFEDGSDTPLRTYSTGSLGVIEIRREDDYQANTLYWVQESQAPEGYILPAEPPRYAFWFSEGGGMILPDGVSAVDLSQTYGSMTVENDGDKTDVPVAKTWGVEESDQWPDSVQAITVGLYAQVGGADPAAVLQDSQPWTVTLTPDHPYDFTTFSQLSAVTEEGQLITYSVRELSVTLADGAVMDPEDLYLVSGGEKENSGYYILNNAPHLKRISVEKQWYEQRLDGTVAAVSAPEDSSFTLYRTTDTSAFASAGNTVSVSTNNTDASYKTVTLAGQTEGLTDGCVLHLTYESETTSAIDSNWRVSNTTGSWYNLPMIPIPGKPMECYVALPYGTRSIRFICYSGSSWGHSYTVTIEKTDLTALLTAADAEALVTAGAEAVDAFTLSAGETYSRDDLEAADGSGGEYAYFVVEDNPGSDTLYRVSEDGIVVDNYTTETEKTTVTAVKEWYDAEGNLMDAPENAADVVFDLYRTTTRPVSSESAGGTVYNLGVPVTNDETKVTRIELNVPTIEVSEGDTLEITLHAESSSNGETGSAARYSFNFRIFANRSYGNDNLLQRIEGYGKASSELSGTYTFDGRISDISKLYFVAYNNPLWVEARVVRQTSAILSEADVRSALPENAEPVVSGIALNAANNWRYSSEEAGDVLELYDGEGNLYYYVAIERPVAGYTASYALDGASLTLRNTRNSEVLPVSTEISGVKILYGRDMQADEFTFILAPEKSMTGHPGMETTRLTATSPAALNGEAATFTFPALTYTAEDYDQAQYRTEDGDAVFYYVVSEEAGDVSGILYSESQYLVRVVLSRDSGGLSIRSVDACPYEGGILAETADGET